MRTRWRRGGDERRGYRALLSTPCAWGSLRSHPLSTGPVDATVPADFPRCHCPLALLAWSRPGGHCARRLLVRQGRRRHHGRRRVPVAAARPLAPTHSLPTSAGDAPAALGHPRTRRPRSRRLAGRGARCAGRRTRPAGGGRHARAPAAPRVGAATLSPNVAMCSLHCWQPTIAPVVADCGADPDGAALAVAAAAGRSVLVTATVLPGAATRRGRAAAAIRGRARQRTRPGPAPRRRRRGRRCTGRGRGPRRSRGRPSGRCRSARLAAASRRSSGSCADAA